MAWIWSAGQMTAWAIQLVLHMIILKPSPFPIFCALEFNLRSCHLRLTLDRAHLCIHIIQTDRQLRPASSVFEQYDPWTEHQVNLR